MQIFKNVYFCFKPKDKMYLMAKSLERFYAKKIASIPKVEKVIANSDTSVNDVNEVNLISPDSTRQTSGKI